MPPVLTTSSLNNVGIPSLINTTAPLSIPPLPVPAPQVISAAFTQDTDLRSVDPRLANRNPPISQNPSMDLDMRMMANQVAMEVSSFPARVVAAPQQQVPQRPVQQTFPSDPRQRNADPRQKTVPAASIPPQRPPAMVIPDSACDPEKKALIMQVLQLTNEQISLLPVEQRASIRNLKAQIAQSTNSQR